MINPRSILLVMAGPALFLRFPQQRIARQGRERTQCGNVKTLPAIQKPEPHKISPHEPPTRPGSEFNPAGRPPLEHPLPDILLVIGGDFGDLTGDAIVAVM